MLVITRKKGESIHIGNEIELTVLDVRNGRARIGILCPREIAILRHELIGRERVKREPLGRMNLQATKQLQEPQEK
jgi:carbon storage regulator